MEKSLSFEYQARYRTMGELTSDTKAVWVICHGYGQLVSFFSKKFQPLADAGHFLIFPEGLHKFYHNIKGKRTPVASWMTSENRLMAIENYLNYIDKVFETECPNESDRIKLMSLGFSQGSNTIIRWLIHRNHVCSNTFICGGNLPRDMDLSGNQEKLNAIGLSYFYGDEDHLISDEFLAEEQGLLDNAGINYDLNKFPGKHTVPVKQIMEYLN